MRVVVCRVFCFQAEDGIRDLVRSRGLGDVYKRQRKLLANEAEAGGLHQVENLGAFGRLSLLLQKRVDLSLIHI